MGRAPSGASPLHLLYTESDEMSSASICVCERTYDIGRRDEHESGKNQASEQLYRAEQGAAPAGGYEENREAREHKVEESGLIPGENLTERRDGHAKGRYLLPPVD